MERCLRAQPMAGDRRIELDLIIVELHAGDRLLEDVRTTGDRLLCAKGHLVTAALLQRLRNYARVTDLREPVRVERIVQEHSGRIER
jgi:hypothetical protein